jgi:hypothetical protein
MSGFSYAISGLLAFYFDPGLLGLFLFLIVEEAGVPSDGTPRRWALTSQR